MAIPVVSPRVKDSEPSPGQLDTAISRGLVEIIEEYGLTSAEDEAEMGSWSYWMPSPGVRYFTYGEWL